MHAGKLRVKVYLMDDERMCYTKDAEPGGSPTHRLADGREQMHLDSASRDNRAATGHVGDNVAAGRSTRLVSRSVATARAFRPNKAG